MASKNQEQLRHYTLALDGRTIHVEQIRSQRKSIGIKIVNHESIQLRIPSKISETEALKVLLKHQSWILKKISGLPMRGQLLENENNVYHVIYHGIHHQLVFDIDPLRKGPSLEYVSHERLFRIYAGEARLVEAEWLLNQFYKHDAKQMVALSLEKYLNDFEIGPSLIQIKDQKARWGSCSSKGEIRLNFRIAQCDQSLCDYLVLHELCHLVHMNHSQQFWALMERLMPDYKERRKALKTYLSDRLIMS